MCACLLASTLRGQMQEPSWDLLPTGPRDGTDREIERVNCLIAIPNIMIQHRPHIDTIKYRFLVNVPFLLQVREPCVLAFHRSRGSF